MCIYIVICVEVVTYLPLYREWILKTLFQEIFKNQNSKIENKYLYLEFRHVYDTSSVR